MGTSKSANRTNDLDSSIDEPDSKNQNNCANSNDINDLFSDAIEFETEIDQMVIDDSISVHQSSGLLYKSHSQDSLVADSEVSLASILLDIKPGQGEHLPSSSVPQREPNSLFSLELDIKQNKDSIEPHIPPPLPSSLSSFSAVPVKSSSKGKNAPVFDKFHLIQSLQDLEFPIHGPIFCIAFSPDGHLLAAAGTDRVIRLWRLLVKQVIDEGSQPEKVILYNPVPIMRLRGHTGEVLALNWSMQSDLLISGSLDSTARLWHPARGTCLGVFPHGDSVTSVCFHPKDESLFLSGSLDCRLRLWSLEKKGVLSWNELPEGNHITAVAFSGNGSVAIAGTSTGFCLFFHTDNDLKYHTQIHVRSQHGRNKKGRKISSIFALPGKLGDQRILVSSNDSRIRLYRLADKSLAIKYRADGYYLNQSSQLPAKISDDGEFIVSGSESGHVVIWNLQDKQPQIPFGRFLSLPFAGRDVVKDFECFRSGHAPLTQAIVAPDIVKFMCRSSGMRSPIFDPVKSASVGLIVVTADFDGSIKVFENNSSLLH